MKEVYLIRHAHAQAGPSKMDRDFFLTAMGNEQAHALGRQLLQRAVKPAKILCSTLTRARQTAAVIAEHVSAPIYEDTGLIEHGSKPLLMQCSFAEAQRKHPDKLMPDGKVRTECSGNELTWDFTIGGENLRELHTRARNAWERIISEAANLNGPLLVVSHGSFLSALMTEVFDVPQNGNWRFSFPNAGCICVKLNKGERGWRPILCIPAPCSAALQEAHN
jgi:2,3-bisphosphoglycerate-dependent phosphoglycerate mutase